MDGGGGAGAHGPVEPPASVPRVLVHLVGRITDTVFSFLGAATAVLAQQGVAQTVVLLDDPLQRHLLMRFHPSVRLVLVKANGSMLETFGGLLDAYCETSIRLKPTAAHLHGLTCSFIGTYAARFRGLSVPTYFSPHGSRLLGPARTLGIALLWMLRPLSGPSAQHTIVNTGEEARMLDGLTDQSVDLVESPVAEAFFQVAPAVGGPPVVVTGSHGINPIGAALFSQCAVLLADQVPGIRFDWFGAADAESVVRLKAANVSIREETGDIKRAARMAASRIFIAPAGSRGFPVYLTEAMAASLPCIAWDTPYHRDILVDGRTGFICSDVSQVIERVADLMDSPALCRRLGEAARQEARSRFDGTRFRHALLDIYAPRPDTLESE